MADQTQIVTIPLLPGVHEDIDRTTAPPGTLVAATNCRVRKGAISKRNGLVDAGVTAQSGTFAGPCDALGFAAGRQIAVMAGNAWARQSIGDPWQIIGRSSRHRPVTTHWQGFPSTQVSCASNSSYVVHAMSDGVDVTLVVQNEAGVRLQFSSFTGRDKPRVFLVGSTFVLVMRETGGVGIYGATVNGSTLAVSAQALITGRQAAGDGYDAAPYSSTTFLVAARATATTVTTNLVDLSFGTTASQSVVCNAAAVTAVSVYGTATEGIWVAFDDSAAQKIAAFNAALSATTGAVTSFGVTATAVAEPTQPAVMTRRDASSVWLFWQEVDTAPANRYVLKLESRTTAAAATAGIAGFAHHLRIASRPWSDDGVTPSMWVHTDNGNHSPVGSWSTQRKYALCAFVVDADVPHSFGMIVEPEIMPDERALDTLSYHPPETASRITTDDSGALVQRRYFPALSVLRTQVTTQGAAAAMIYEWETQAGFDARMRQIVEVGGQGLIAGGGLQELQSSRLTSAALPSDISRGVENGFLFAPAILSGSATAGGALTSGAIYFFCVVSEYITPDGLRVQSAPGNAQRIAPSGGNLTATITITTSPTTEREFSSPPCATVHHVYATIGNGDTFLRVSDDDGVPSVGDSVTQFLTFTHSATDLSIADNEPLYTEQSGTPPNEPCPAHRFAWSGGGRLAVGGLFNPRIVEFSKLALPNEPIRFTRSGKFRCLLPEGATGGIWLDNQHVVFVRTGIYLVPVTGADDTSPGVGQAQRLPSTVGCVDFRSIVELPQGVGFQSQRGYEILPRGFGAPRLISGPVQESLRGRRVISAAVVANAGSAFGSAERVGEHLLVLSAVDGGAATAGVRLVYDLEFERWLSTDANTANAFPYGEVLTAWDGRLVVAARSGTQIQYESPTDWGTTETGSLSVTVADARPFGAMARGRMHRLQLMGEIRSNANISGNLYFDGEYSRPVPLEERRAWGTPGDKFVLEWELPTNELSAIGVDLTVSSATAAQGEDSVLHSIGIESSPLAGRPRLAQDRSG